jgi:adenosylcobinamide-phosphate synthase
LCCPGQRDGAPAVLFAALLLDRLIGDPDWLWRRFSHPVVIFGHAIGWADKRFNRPDDSAEIRRRNGRLTIAGAVVAGGHHRGLLASLFARWALSARCWK